MVIKTYFKTKLCMYFGAVPFYFPKWKKVINRCLCAKHITGQDYAPKAWESKKIWMKQTRLVSKELPGVRWVSNLKISVSQGQHRPQTGRSETQSTRK
jgi:hypothetical protein